LHITVQKLPKSIDNAAETVAVVVDVLRATSVMATAVQNGAEQIITCLEVDEAWQIAQGMALPPLLCGERHCKPIVGFDLGNSPSEYSPAAVAGRTIVMTTTNGTRALFAARDAKAIYAGAFINLTAVSERVRGERSITIICAGTDGVATDEDFLFAGALIAKIASFEREIMPGGDAMEAIDNWRAFLDEGSTLAHRLARSRGGKNLVDAGYRSDVDFCSVVDAVSAVPTASSRTPMTLRG